MPRLVLGIIVASIVSVAALPALAEAAMEDNLSVARQFIARGQLKRAETNLKNSIERAADQQDVGVARAAVLLSTVYRDQGKFAESQAALDRARSVYKVIGTADPEYAEACAGLAAQYRLFEPDVLGSAGSALKKSSGTISMAKGTAGAKFEIRIDAPYQNSLNNGKLDGLQLDRLVTFDLEQPSPTQINVINIKGFRIHSVEKNMWVNLLSLKIGPADSEGKYDTELTAGKAGITKTVASKLPQSAYLPIANLASQLSKFAEPVAPDLPIAIAPPASQPATTQAAPSSDKSQTRTDVDVQLSQPLNATSPTTNTLPASPAVPQSMEAASRVVVPIPASANSSKIEVGDNRSSSSPSGDQSANTDTVPSTPGANPPGISTNGAAAATQTKPRASYDVDIPIQIRTAEELQRAKSEQELSEKRKSKSNEEVSRHHESSPNSRHAHHEKDEPDDDDEGKEKVVESSNDKTREHRDSNHEHRDTSHEHRDTDHEPRDGNTSHEHHDRDHDHERHDGDSNLKRKEDLSDKGDHSEKSHHHHHDHDDDDDDD